MIVERILGGMNETSERCRRNLSLFTYVRKHHGPKHSDQSHDKAFTGELNNNDAAKDFAAKLPLKLKFEDFGTTERISYLPKPLSLGTAPRNCDPQKGDIAYYIPWGNLAVFVRDFRPSDNLVPLGKLSSKSLEVIQESGSKDVEISLVK